MTANFPKVFFSNRQNHARSWHVTKAGKTTAEKLSASLAMVTTLLVGGGSNMILRFDVMIQPRKRARKKAPEVSNGADESGLGLQRCIHVPR